MSDVADYNRQGAPRVVEGAVSSHDLAVADLRSWGTMDVEAAVAVLAERKAYGLAKYDSVLHKDNGRDHALDAEDESVDQVVYLRTWMDDCMTRRDFETAEWVWSMYQKALAHFVAIAHYRRTGERLGSIRMMSAPAPQTHPDVPPYRVAIEGDSYQLIRPWEPDPAIA